MLLYRPGFQRGTAGMTRNDGRRVWTKNCEGWNDEGIRTYPKISVILASSAGMTREEGLFENFAPSKNFAPS